MRSVIGRIISNEIRLEMRANAPGMLTLVNKNTHEIVAKSTRMELLVRTPDEISEPVFLSNVTSAEISDESFIRLKYGDRSSGYEALLTISGSEHGIKFDIDVKSPKVIWLVEWKITGLVLEGVVVPALGGQILTEEMPPGQSVSYKYPFWWNAQFVLGQTEKGGILLGSRDPSPDLKMLRVTRDAAGFGLALGFEAPGPLREKTLKAEWYLDCYHGDWKSAAVKYQHWMEKAFRVEPLDSNKYFPSWAKSIDFVLEIWGMRKDRPQPHHTFGQIADRLKAWRKLHPPERTLVYLPGFAEGGIDSRAPDYNPSAELGGKQGFRDLVDLAHTLGYKVMIHTNVLALTYSHPLFPSLKEHQVVDVFGRPQGWALDMDGDWLTEPYFAYVNPGAKAWGDLMEKVLGNLIREFSLDAVFLDQTLLAFNVSKGPNFVAGMRSHIARLQKSFPEILFAGEGMHEQVVSVLPMAQIHGIDSITEVHGLEGVTRWKKAHPISTFIFGRYTRFVAHLLAKHPSNPIFHLQEKAYSELGVIPALCLYDNDQPIDMPEVRRMIRRASRLMTHTKPNQEKKIGKN